MRVLAIPLVALAMNGCGGDSGQHLAPIPQPHAQKSVSTYIETPTPTCGDSGCWVYPCDVCSALIEIIVQGNYSGDAGSSGGTSPLPLTDQSASTDQDLSAVNTAAGACSAFGEGYDPANQVCYLLGTLGEFGMSKFTYGACRAGSYTYNGSAYVLTCKVPPHPNPNQPNVFYQYTFLPDTGPPIVGPEAIATAGSTLEITVRGPRVVFTNLSIAFFAAASATKPFTTGGAISVGIGI